MRPESFSADIVYLVKLNF